jgi:RNA ligase (TIGR02306 family)
MSTFKVSLEHIATSAIHPNADRLSICTLEGMSFQFVTGRNQFEPGARVVYYPIDSFLPPRKIEALGLIGKLAGPLMNRVKTVSLRGAISQGLVEPALDWPGAPQGYDLTEALGVVKYEPEAVTTQNADLFPLSVVGLSMYDIEGAERHPGVVDTLMDVRCQITEKLEGSNIGITARLGEVTAISSRERVIVEHVGKTHPMCVVAREQGLVELAESYISRGASHVTIYGEYLGPGVQGNIYGLSRKEIRCFDVKVGQVYMDPEDALHQVACAGASWVPVLGSDITLREFLAGRTIQEAGNGGSLLPSNCRREGIVVKPMKETRHPTLGRLIIKQRSPAYLAHSNL